MNLGEVAGLIEDLRERWSEHTEVAVSSKVLSSNETIIGHYEPETVDGGPVILVVGKKESK